MAYRTAPPAREVLLRGALRGVDPREATESDSESDAGQAESDGSRDDDSHDDEAPAAKETKEERRRGPSGPDSAEGGCGGGGTGQWQQNHTERQRRRIKPAGDPL